jgi:hypothetical protein
MTRIWIAFFALTPPLCAQSTGTITGILTNDGNPVPGAFVTAYLQASSTGGKLMPAINALTESDGSFKMKGVPAGTYRLCIEKTSAALLDPCQWSPVPNSVTVTPGDDASITMLAQAGISMTIRVDDPTGLLANDPRSVDILINAKTTSGRHIAAVLASKDKSGKTMTMVVPVGVPIDLMIYSSRLALTDDQGHVFTSPNVAVTLSAPTPSTAPQTGVTATQKSSVALTLTVKDKRT